MQSYYNDIFLPDLTPETMGHIVDLGRNSPGSRLPEAWADPPVGYVPASWPTGPRNLPSGRYTCPYKGCRHPVGPTEQGEGYSRTTLGPHLVSHEVHDGAHCLRSTVRARVMALRRAQRRYQGDVVDVFDHSNTGDEADDLQRWTDSLVLDLEELKNWEQSSRVVARRPRASAIPARKSVADNCDDDDNDDDNDMVLCFPSRDEKMKHEPQETAEEADDESVPHQNSNRFRNNRFRRLPDALPGMRRREVARSPLLVEGFERSSSAQEMETETDGSRGPPKKKARRSRPQLSGSCKDSALRGGEEPMELD